jgi:hypothetical protein
MSTVFAVALIVAACSGNPDAAPTTPAPATTSTTVSSTTSTPSTTSATSTTSTTSNAPTPTTTDGPAASSTSTTSSSTTSVVPAPVCDRAQAIAILDDTVESARLSPAGPWTDDTLGVVFDERTDTGEEYARLQGYDCGLRVAQRTDDGVERLALIAWNDRRHALVVQATAAPATPYGTDALFQLYIEQPYGEFIVDQFVWAATMAGGESIVVGSRDTSIALAAKSWQADVPPFDDLPVALDAERYGIDTLVAAGGRNVAVAEPAPVGWEIGSLMLATPWALPAFVAVGPAALLDPMVPIVADGDTTFHQIGNVTVRVTSGDELPGIVLHEAGWTCDDHAWRLMSGWGSPEEILEFATQVVTTACGASPVG